MAIVGFVLLAIFGLCQGFDQETHYGCAQKGPCICAYSDGSFINLEGAQPAILHLNETSSLVFQPCNDMETRRQWVDSKKYSSCSNDTSLCLVTVDTIKLGKYEDFHFISNESTGAVYLKSHFKNWTSSILLQCSSNLTTIAVSTLDLNNNIANLIYSSPKACLVSNNQSGLSMGTILFILFIALILAYFVGGYCLKKFIFGYDGIEAIPNHTFWITIMERLHNLILFIAQGCTRGGGYDQI